MRTKIFVYSFISFITITSCKKDLGVLKKSFFTETLSGASGTTTNQKFGKLTDIDGNVYKTIQIGSQIWMTENLRVKRYANGELIDSIADGSQWNLTSAGAWCYHNNNYTLNIPFGKLYNWYAVKDKRGLAPKGWHIPTQSEWMTLFNYLGGIDKPETALKLKSTSGWYNNGNGNNSSGFSALGGGLRFNNGYFSNDFTVFGYYWSSTDADNNAWRWDVGYYEGRLVGTGWDLKQLGFSVRCIKN